MNTKNALAFLTLCLMTSVASSAIDSSSVSAALGTVPATQTIDLPPGTVIGATWSGNWTANQFSCPPTFALGFQHYNGNSSNNASWFVCVKQ